MIKDRLLRYIVYLRRGHSSYLAFLVSLANFLVIQYRLLIEYVPALSKIFESLSLFAVSFIAVYVPLVIVIGWLDVKRMTVPKEVEVNPYFYKPSAKEKIYWGYCFEVFKVLEELAKEKGLDVGKIKEARKEVEEWIKS
ncbi:TPA: hypothetical protein EYP26_03945 [Candidatus Bathyarchaeota archaeon]|nr:hypothetical protein [Candidatus Bathyarchaeota archaeon]